MESSASEAVQRDRAALVALYRATDGPNWDDSTNWLSDAPLRVWQGVTTDASGRVTENSPCRQRPDGDTAGRVEQPTLSNLMELHLGWNDLTGAIPAEWGHLNNLTELHLDHKLSLNWATIYRHCRRNGAS